MLNDLMLDFPVLKHNNSDFKEGISYNVTATQANKKLTIEHTLSGQSYISELIKKNYAKFSVLLLYKNIAKRENHGCDHANVKFGGNKITAIQIIDINFSYAPEISPSIIITEDQKITADDASGLSDFWKDEIPDISKYSRIALHPKLKFTDGTLSSLISIELKEDLSAGVMEVDVEETAKEGKIPVTLFCAKDVFDELRQVTSKEPSNCVEAARSAIITQALCAMYAYMKNLNSNDEVEGVLAAHLELLKDTTGKSWTDEYFNPSWAATKMHPYAIKAFGNEDD